jgi:hypothetical protein
MTPKGTVIKSQQNNRKRNLKQWKTTFKTTGNKIETTENKNETMENNKETTAAPIRPLSDNNITADNNKENKTKQERKQKRTTGQIRHH